MVSDAFRRRIAATFGRAGADWLATLPDRVAALAARWSLRVDPPFPNLSYNYVASAWRADGTPAVLKLGVPNPELTSEIAVLTLAQGVGYARLLAADADAGALLLERLRPGTPLTALAEQADEQAAGHAAAVMAALWRPVPAAHELVTVADWGRGFGRLRATFNGGSGPFPERLVTQAERLWVELGDSAEVPVVLHGDLHGDNILAAGGGTWRAIDPKGVIGERAYEPGALLRNLPAAARDSAARRRAAARRAAVISERLGLDPTRVLGWGMAQAVLSAWWSFEDEGQPGAAALALAADLAHLLARRGHGLSG